MSSVNLPVSSAVKGKSNPEFGSDNVALSVWVPFTNIHHYQCLVIKLIKLSKNGRIYKRYLDNWPS